MFEFIRNLLIREDQKKQVGHFIKTGTSGTQKQAGYYEEEYLIKIRGLDGMDLYDEMRRADAQIRMLLSTIKYPLLSANWFVEAADETPEAIFQKELIEHILFQDMGFGSNRKTWREFLVECLSMFDFGFSLFEVIHKIVQDDPKFGNYVGLKDLGFRSQRTIDHWHTHKSGKLISVYQDVSGDFGFQGDISGENLLVFSVNKEGDNYEGISLLRPIYGNWFRKNEYYKLLAIGIERTTNSVPIIKYPDEIGPGDPKLDDAKSVAEDYTSHQNQFIMAPKAFEFDSWKLEFDADKVLNAIKLEDTSMAKAFLANFMEMGLSGTGSFALGTDISDLFLGGISHYADLVVEKFNISIIPTLIDAKFGKQEVYPKLSFSGINDKAGKELAEIVSMLSLNGLITNDARLKEFLHKTYGLPDIIEEEEIADPVKQEAEIEGAFQDAVLKAEKVIALKEADAPKKPQMEFNFADPTKKFIEETADTLQKLMRGILDQRAIELIKAIEREMRKNPNNLSLSRPSVMKFDIPGKIKYREMLEEFMGGLTQDTAQKVLKELKIDVDVAKPPAKTKQRQKAEVELLAGTQESDLRKNVLFEYNTKVDTATSIEQLTGDLKQSKDNYVLGPAIAVGAVNVVASTVNNTRSDVFQLPEVSEQIESFIFVNPDPVAPICQELAGRVFTKEEFLTTNNLPPLHHNCKSIIQAQTTGAKGNKSVNPIGLSFTGTEKQVENIINSKKF